MIRLKENEKPHLKFPKMVCDDVIHEKLKKYEMINDCLSKSSVNVVLGRMGSGKTSLVLSFLTNKEIFKGTFHNLFLYIPFCSISSLRDNIFEKMENEEGYHQYDELTEENIEHTRDKIKEATMNKEYSLLIIDDMQEQLKQKDVKKILENLIIKKRHYRLTIFILQQSYKNLELRMRQLMDNFFIFELGKNEMRDIFDETIKLKEQTFNDVLKIAYNDSNKHNFLVINNKSKKMYKNFDEIEINE
jgi:KaiC/GvpD/RAD55 family RecA-like ATPase